MEIIVSKSRLISCISDAKRLKKKVGFVPTMGALHQGHLSLLAAAKKQNDIVVCSIFVNPTQFNNKEDLLKYPRTLEKDTELLKNAGCDILFCPDENEMYPEGEKPEEKFDFENLENVMEGEYRPGHFQGVATVVKKLFDLVQPDNAYFGEKDFQQIAVIRKMVQDFDYKTTIVSCPIIREKNGLAMSSRNERLSGVERKEAAILYRTLEKASELLKKSTVAEVKEYVSNVFAEKKNMKLDYFEICDEATLQPIENIANAKYSRAFIAVFVGAVRLIDNVAL